MCSLDNDLLEQWCAFCEGTSEFEEHHFSTIFMEGFLDFGKEQARYIKTICEYFDNGRQMAKMLCRFHDAAPSLTERQLKGRLLKFTKADIAQKLPLLKRERQPQLHRLIKSLPVSYTTYDRLQQSREESEINDDYRLHVENALAPLLVKDAIESELSEAVYKGFGHDLRFTQIFDTYMLQGAEPLVHDFELWLLRGEYVISETEVLVAQEPIPEGVLVWPDDFQ